MTAPSTAPVLTLTAHDRCDLCGAQAMVKAVMQAGDLLFCGHHGRKFRTQLDTTALQVLQVN